MRMPKGWTFIGTNDLSFGNTETKQERNKREKRFQDAIDNTPIQKYEELKKERENAYSTKVEKDNQLLQAYNEKKLKSKNLIKEARNLKKAATV